MAQLTFTITVPNANATDYLNTVTNFLGYKTEINDPDNPGKTIPNPQSRKEYFNEKLLDWVRDNYISGKAVSDAEIARQTAIDSAASINISITD